MKSAPLNRIASLNFAIVVCLVGGCNETRVNKFEDKNDGVLNELIMKGWLPLWIPDDAKDILENQVLSTSQVYKCDRFLIVYRDNQVFGWTTGQ